MPQRHSGGLGACLVAGVLAFLGAPRGAAAFGQMNTPGASVQEQCLAGFQGLRKACGNVAAEQAAPPMQRRATTCILHKPPSILIGWSIEYNRLGLWVCTRFWLSIKSEKSKVVGL